MKLDAETGVFHKPRKPGATQVGRAFRENMAQLTP